MGSSSGCSAVAHGRERFNAFVLGCLVRRGGEEARRRGDEERSDRYSDNK